MLCAFSTRLQATLGSLAVPPDSGEVVEAFRLLKELPLDGAVITGDAAFTYQPLAAAIREAGGDYFLFVKGNQPELEAELVHAFGDVFPLKNRIPSGPGS
jgi:predicted transposase YbfD/YdcC